MVGTAAALAGLLGVPILLLAVLGGGASGVAAATVTAAVCQSLDTPAPTPTSTASTGLDGAQTDAARQIAAAASTRGVGEQGAAIALDVALARTRLRASLSGVGSGAGVFAMTPTVSMSAEELTDTYASANVFFDLLEKVVGWQFLSPAAAASAALPEETPGSYAAAWPQAQQLATTLADATTDLASSGPSCDPTGSGLTSAEVDQILAFAGAQVGDAYVLGANGPDAWDCSSLVQAAFAQVGVHLPRVASDQYEWFRDHAVIIPGPVTPNELQPGDVLFSHGSDPDLTDDGQLIGHVEIYAGGGVAINAKGSKWGVIRSTYPPNGWGFVTWVGRLPAPPPASSSPSASATTP